MDPTKEFREKVRQGIMNLGQDQDMLDLTRIWMRDTLRHQYSYNFTCLSRPIIQYPQDIVAMQELIWKVNPDLIIETGIAHGGSLVLSASVLALLDYCDAVATQKSLDPKSSKRRVLGIDIDIREHNRAAIEKHPLSHMISMFSGSSVAPQTIQQVLDFSENYERVLVVLDSNHTHQHVLEELEAYAPLVSKQSYCVVFDTLIEDFKNADYSNRPWGVGNNPKTAVWEYLRRLKEEGRQAKDGAPLEFEIDKEIEHKLLITVAPDGYLKRT